MTIKRTIRGIRDRIPSGYLLGRSGKGDGPVELIKTSGITPQGSFSGGSEDAITELTGDVTAVGPGAVPATIANNAVSNVKLRDSGALSVIGRSANSTGDPADISASAASDAVLRESGSVLGFGTIATAGIANDAVTYAKMQNVSAASKLIGRGDGGSGDPQEISLGTALSISGTTLNGIAATSIAYQDGTVPGGNTVANTTTETTFTSSYTIPANSLIVGSVLHITLFGVYGTAVVGPTLTLRLKIGGTTVLTTGALTTVGSLTNLGWSAEALVIVTAIGASGSLEVQGYFEFSTAATTTLSVNTPNTSPYTKDTTGSLAITVTAQWGTADASNTITLREMLVSLETTVPTMCSTTEQLTGTEGSKASSPDSVAALWEQGSDIASAATISIGEGGYFHVTGTTTITDIDFATTKAGREARLIFDGVLTLTHNATTLILPTGANITTAAGDECIVVSEGGDNVRVVSYQRKSGAALAGGYVRLGQIVASGSPTSLDISSGLTGYEDLFFSFWGKSTATGATFRDLGIRLNGDSGNNYQYQLHLGGGSTSFASFTGATAQIVIGGLPTSTAGDANAVAEYEGKIANYAGTSKRKNIAATGGYSITTGSGNTTVFNVFGKWLNTSAVTQITAIITDGSAFEDGATLTVWGRKA